MTHSDRRGANLFYAALEKGDAEALVSYNRGHKQLVEEVLVPLMQAF